MAYFVYELRNESRKELYVGFSNSLSTELGELRRSPPPEIKAWSLEARRTPRILDVFSRKDEAQAFVRRCALGSGAPRGWVVLIAGRLTLA